jgi:hypothetical protein
VEGHLVGVAVVLAVVTAGGYIRRNDQEHFTYAVYGRWWRQWLALLSLDLLAIAVLHLIG